MEALSQCTDGVKERQRLFLLQQFDTFFSDTLPLHASLTGIPLSRSPLADKAVLIPLGPDIAQPFATLLEARGGRPRILPEIKIVDPPEWNEADHAIHRLSDYHGILFTDRHAVEFFLKRIHAVDAKQIRQLASCRIVATGARTEELLFDAGLASSIVPRTSTSLDLESMLARAGTWQRRYLCPHAKDEQGTLAEHVRALGGIVDEVIVYQQKLPPANEIDDIRRALLKRQIAATAFLAPPSAQHAADLVGRDALSHSAIAAIGPSTAEAVRNVGLVPRIIPGRSSPEVLLDSLEQYFSPPVR